MGYSSLLHRPGTRGEENMGGGPILITNDAEVIFFFKVNLLLHGWQEIRRRMFCFLCVKLIKAEVVFPNGEQRVCEW